MDDFSNHPASDRREPLKNLFRKIIRQWPTLLLISTFLFGLFSGYAASKSKNQPGSGSQADQNSGASQINVAMEHLRESVNPPDGYDLGVSYGNLGPKILSSGGIDLAAFTALYEASGNPLSEKQLEILSQDSELPIVINAENAHFLLNFFWAVGLVNTNPILTEGPIAQQSGGQIERFASTGGWTLGTKPVAELFASQVLISLTPEQQMRVEEAAAMIYRPCCDNPTLFPDCNHGMAMLGLLELMASQNASLEEMLLAAKYVNAFWFPQQALETAIYLEANQGVSYRDADPRMIVGKELSSGSGFAMVHQYLQGNGLLEQTPGNASSCSN